MKIFEKIKNFFSSTHQKIVSTVSIGYIESIDNINLKYEFLRISKNEKLFKYIEKLALDLCEKENVKVFNMSFDKLNSNIESLSENDKAVGVFRYVLKENMKSYSQKINEYRIKYFHDPDTYRVCSIPRIELSEKADVFTLLHEIGHYFIYKRDQEQTESAADAYCEEFFDNYLPEFFKWVFQIELQIYTKKSRQDFTTFECLKYYKQYKEWIENNSECADV